MTAYRKVKLNPMQKKSNNNEEEEYNSTEEVFDFFDGIRYYQTSMTLPNI